MGSFNPINLIFNTMGVANINNFANQNAQNTSNMGVQNGAIQNQGLNVNQNTNAPYINYAQNGTINNLPPALSNAQQSIISTVEVEMRANYIKDLLNLPRDFQTLINQIEGNNPNVAILKDLDKLLIGGKINLNLLSSILNQSSKDAIQKLMMTIMTVSKMGSNDVNQLKEIMNLFSGAKGGMDSIQTLKNLILLYLPYLPLSVRADMNLDFNIDIFDKIQGQDPESESDTEIIKIMIQTANFSNVLATLENTLNNDIEVFISATESFPEKEVMERLKLENKKSNITSHTTIEKNKDPETSEKLKQNIKITSSNYVSPRLILCAHNLIKIIIDVDSSDFIINKQ